MGCVHRCTFCYVRAYERRADRPSDDRYGTSIRVKINVADVLRRELARPSWQRETVAIGAATDPYQPAEGRYRLTRACLEALADAGNPFGIITRGPMIVRDIDVLAEAARRASVSRDLLDPDARRRRLAQDGARHRPPSPAPPGALDARRGRHRAGVGMAPILPGISDRPEQLARGRQGGARGRRDAASGRTSSTCVRARASTSSSTSRRTGPSSYRTTSSSTAGARTSRRRRRSRCAGKSPRWPASLASPTGAPSRSSRRNCRNNSNWLSESRASACVRG